MELTTVINQILNTLRFLEMPPTYDNSNHMTGIYQALFFLRDQLAQSNAPEPAEPEEPVAEAPEAEIVSEETVGGAEA